MELYCEKVPRRGASEPGPGHWGERRPANDSSMTTSVGSGKGGCGSYTISRSKAFLVSVRHGECARARVDADFWPCLRPSELTALERQGRQQRIAHAAQILILGVRLRNRTLKDGNRLVDFRLRHDIDGGICIAAMRANSYEPAIPHGANMPWDLGDSLEGCPRCFSIG